MFNLDHNQSIRLGNTLLAVAGAMMLTVVGIYSYFQGYSLLSTTAATVSVVGFWVVNAVFVGLILTGVNLRFRDPAMSMAQMYWATVTTLLLMATMTEMRELTYLLLFIIMSFGIFRLSPMQFNRYCAVSVFGFAVVQLSTSLQQNQQQTPFDLLVTWIIFTFCAITLTFLCTSLVKLRTRLKEKNQELEAALKVKSAFVANMSHEIRTPMNGVLGMLGIVLRGDLSKQQREYVEIAESSANSLLTVINDILDFSKIEAGKLTLEEVAFNPSALISDVAASFGFSVLEKKLELIVDCSPDLPEVVVADPMRLRQILNNLLGNAIKFTDEGEIIISFKTIEQRDDSVSLQCSVTDTGVGIAPEQLDEIFSSFSQADSSTTREYGGTGLGLCIARQLCQLMGGDIQVKSTLGQGSCFSFTISAKRSTSEIPQVKGLDLTGASVLVVDDNNTNRLVLEKQLQHIGATVVTARDGLDALSILEKHDDQTAFLLAVIDMQMPNMDGEILIETIRRNHRYDSMKIIMLTSMVGEFDETRLTELRIAARLYKPLRSDQLYTHIRHCFNQDYFNQYTPLRSSHAPTAIKKSGKENDSWCNFDSNHSGNVTDTSFTRILLVEDNPTNQAVARITLEDLGYSIDIANNGEEALKQLKTSTLAYDLIFMDCQMPGMDGYETTRAIRQSSGMSTLSDVPIIAMTANVMAGDKEKCIAAGMNDHIGKPIEPDIVAEKINRWLSKKTVLSQPVEDTASMEQLELQQAPVWDKEALLKRVKNREDRATTLVELFLLDFDVRTSEIDQAIKREECQSIKSIAHSIKGSAANLGAVELQEVMADIEASADHDDIIHIKKMHTIIAQCTSNLSRELNQYLGRT